MQKKTGSIFVFVLAAFSILTSACGSAPSPAANSKPENKFEERVAGKPGGTLTYRFSAPPKTFNYLMAADEPSIVTTLYLLSSRPIEFDHRSQKYVAALTETWTAADGQTVDIKLRDGLKFSDGHALTSDDVIFSLKAIYDEKTDSPAFRDAMLINGGGSVNRFDTYRKVIAALNSDEGEMRRAFDRQLGSEWGHYLAAHLENYPPRPFFIAGIGTNNTRVYG
ncbi:MAG: ABC transporter substrate-binding protein, partial [Acidobacteriota bacterium]